MDCIDGETMGFTPAREREGWVLLKIPRGDSDIRWGLKDPESGEEAQTRGRPARDRWLPLPKTGDVDDVYYYNC